MKQATLRAVLAVVVLIANTTVSGETVTVPESFATIQAAIVAASAGDTVLVGSGTYLENIDFLGKPIHVKSSDGPEVTIIDGSMSTSVVRFQTGETLTSILEGFTLTNGSGELIGPVLRYGGGVFCAAVSSPSLIGNIITENRADFGGGIACWDHSSPNIVNNWIRGNHALQLGVSLGGGIYCDIESSPLIEGNRIDNNVAALTGGGIYAGTGASPAIIENMIRWNDASEDGQGGGGGIACVGTSSTRILRNTIAGNYGGSGGAFVCAGNDGPTLVLENHIFDNWAVAGAGIACVASSGPLIESNLIEDNCGFSGVGIECVGSPRIFGNVIRGNMGEGGGVGIICGDLVSSPLIANNLIVENVSTFPGFSGAGVYISAGATPVLINNTITRNASASPGSGLVVIGGTTNPLIVNTIVWGNDGPDEFTAFVNIEPTLINCDVRGGWSGPGSGNFDADPMFVAPAKGDFHLRFGSPCVDAGNETEYELPEFDFEGDTRVVNGNAGPMAKVDIGADELRPEIAARFGTVNALQGSLFNPLLVNGIAGDYQRVLEIPVGEPIRVDVLAPPSVLEPARFALYAWEEEPDLVTITPQPYRLGVMSFPTPLSGGSSQMPRITWNNLGHEVALGAPDRLSSPGPTTLVDLPHGVAFPLTVTIQGFIEDSGSAADGPVSISNAVVLKVVN